MRILSGVARLGLDWNASAMVLSFYPLIPAKAGTQMRWLDLGLEGLSGKPVHIKQNPTWRDLYDELA